MLTELVIAGTVIFFICTFYKSLQMIVMYIERMIIINTSEDFVNFDQRANIVKEQLEELGPVRVEDLPSLFLRHNIPNVTSNKQITDKPRQKGSRKRVNKS